MSIFKENDPANFGSIFLALINLFQGQGHHTVLIPPMLACFILLCLTLNLNPALATPTHLTSNHRSPPISFRPVSPHDPPPLCSKSRPFRRGVPLQAPTSTAVIGTSTSTSCTTMVHLSSPIARTRRRGGRFLYTTATAPRPSRYVGGRHERVVNRTASCRAVTCPSWRNEKSVRGQS